MTAETKLLPCVKVAKHRGEAIRRALLERNLLRTDARIISNDRFIYLPLTTAVADRDLNELHAGEVTTQEFRIREHRPSLEELLGFKPSFEIVGDIAVLTEAVEPAKEEIVADALLRLQRNVTVVAKRISAVEGVYRTRRLVVIAGEHRTETVHREHDCRFKLNLEKVYFNPRLAGERARVAAQVARSGKPEEVIDMFAGVGPFAIQIAKRAPQSHVTAIDINPEAVRYLTENIQLNRVQNVTAVEGDIREMYRGFQKTADRLIMNLPKSAHLFLREALSMLKPDGGIIHFYDLESAYPEEGEEKRDSVDNVIEKAKERLLFTLEALSDEFRIGSVELREARKVKAYAPYAYIVGIDAAVATGKASAS
jgi:tRNA (guanine37-N1)-methyltransferase